MNRAESRLLAGIILSSLLAFTALGQQPDATLVGKKSPSAPESSGTTAPEIAPAQFEALFSSIKATESELRWLEIPWIGTLREGREAAASAKKPFFLWAMNGHPLGTC
jgi:hypothetical protein